MNLRELQKNWHRFGQTDPLWAILTKPEKKGGRWGSHEFFATGRREIETVLKQIGGLGLQIGHGRALDFGCGVGRLTQALAEHFGQVHGVDIAPSMIDRAHRYNTHGRRCEYHLNESDDLALFGDDRFDLVYSNITLQHMEPRYAENYIVEFLRVLAPGGALVFQMPSERSDLSQATVQPVPNSPDEPVMETHAIARDRVVRLLESHEAHVVTVREDTNAGEKWISYRYYVTNS